MNVFQRIIVLLGVAALVTYLLLYAPWVELESEQILASSASDGSWLKWEWVPSRIIRSGFLNPPVMRNPPAPKDDAKYEFAKDQALVEVGGIVVSAAGLCLAVGPKRRPRSTTD